MTKPALVKAREELEKSTSSLSKLSKMFAAVLAILGMVGCSTPVRVLPPQIVSCTEYLRPEALEYRCPSPIDLSQGDVFEKGLYAGIDARGKLTECSLKFDELQTILKLCNKKSEDLKKQLGTLNE